MMYEDDGTHGGAGLSPGMGQCSIPPILLSSRA